MAWEAPREDRAAARMDLRWASRKFYIAIYKYNSMRSGPDPGSAIHTPGLISLIYLL